MADEITVREGRELFAKYCRTVGIAAVPGTFIPLDQDEAEAFGAFEEDAVSEREALEASFDNADDYAPAA